MSLLSMFAIHIIIESYKTHIIPGLRAKSMRYSNEGEIDFSTSDGSVQAKKIDYIELYVGNASQAAYYYRNALGFTPTAFIGLETGIRDRSSILVQQKDIRLILS